MNILSIRSLIGKLLAGCILLFFLLGLAALPARAASAASPTCGSWNIVSSPNPSADYNTLQGVAAVSANNVWAVGGEANPSTGIQQTLIEQWNGTGWNVVSSPNIGTGNNSLNSVAAFSVSDTWAVGAYQTSKGANRALIEQWNGTSWNVVSSPKVGSSSILSSVAAVSANNVWAVGSYQTSTGANLALIEHWNGTGWHVVSSPSLGSGDVVLSSVTAISANNVWTVGTYIPSSGTEQTLTEQWNGKHWNVVASPNAASSISYLNGVAQIPGSKTLWAVGGYYTGVHYEPLIEQWSGTSWSIVSSPGAGPDDNFLYTVAAVSADDVWAVGDYYDPNSGNNLTLVEQWNGTSWNVVSSPNAGSGSNYFFSVASVPASSDLWTVGNSQSSPVQTLTAFYC